MWVQKSGEHKGEAPQRRGVDGHKLGTAVVLLHMGMAQGLHMRKALGVHKMGGSRADRLGPALGGTTCMTESLEVAVVGGKLVQEAVGEGDKLVRGEAHNRRGCSWGQYMWAQIGLGLNRLVPELGG